MEELVHRPEPEPERKQNQLPPRESVPAQPELPPERLEAVESSEDEGLVHSLTLGESIEPLEVSPNDPLVTHVDRVEDAYEELEVLGQGGMGVVLLARERATGDEVALKRLRRHADAARFLREARTVASLQHPGIVRLRRVLVSRGHEHEVALVLEVVRGSDLEARISRGGALDLRVALELGRKVAEALAYAHDQGVVHRDVKPANVLVGEDGLPRLTDFGLALSVDLQSLVHSGTWAGTLDYMAPEQRTHADQVDGRADIYGLGATLYRLLTGDSPRVIRERRIPEQARELVLRCVEDRPDERFPHMPALIAALDQALDRLRRDASGTRAPLERIADDFRRRVERTSHSGRIRRLAVASAGLAALNLLPRDAPQRLQVRLELGEPIAPELERLVALTLDAASQREGSSALLADAYAVFRTALAGAELDTRSTRALERLHRASRRPSRPDLSTRLGRALRELAARRAFPRGTLTSLAALAGGETSPAQVLEAILAALRQEAVHSPDAQWLGAEARWRHALRELAAALPEATLAERLRRERLAVELESLSRVEDDELDEDGV